MMIMDEIEESSVTANNKRILPVIKLNPLENLGRRQRLWVAIKRVSRNYVENTSVHGFYYLRGMENESPKRLLL